PRRPYGWRGPCGRSTPRSRTSASFPPWIGRRVTVSRPRRWAPGSRRRRGATGLRSGATCSSCCSATVSCARSRAWWGPRPSRIATGWCSRPRRPCGTACLARAPTIPTTPTRRWKRPTDSRRSRTRSTRRDCGRSMPARPSSSSTCGPRSAPWRRRGRGRGRRAGHRSAGAMTIPLARRYRGAHQAAGPLLYLRRTRRVALGEAVVIHAPGQPPRRGQVIDAGEEITVIQVLEDTVGLAPARVELTLTGEAASAVVGRELLGRALNGMGMPLDGLPSPVGEDVRPIWAAPLNPARRARPADFIETGISAIDGMNTLVRGQKLPVFSGAGLPGLELAAQLVEGARAPRDEPFAVIFVGLGITAREADTFLERFERSGARERSVLYVNETRDPTIERLLAPRIALAEAEFLAFEA